MLHSVQIESGSSLACTHALVDRSIDPRQTQTRKQMAEGTSSRRRQQVAAAGSGSRQRQQAGNGNKKHEQQHKNGTKTAAAANSGKVDSIITGASCIARTTVRPLSNTLNPQLTAKAENIITGSSRITEPPPTLPTNTPNRTPGASHALPHRYVMQMMHMLQMDHRNEKNRSTDPSPSIQSRRPRKAAAALPVDTTSPTNWANRIGAPGRKLTVSKTTGKTVVASCRAHHTRLEDIET